MSVEETTSNLDNEIRRVFQPARPIPLEAVEPEANAYPTDALPPLLRGAVEAVAEHVQCPVAIAGQSVLTAASLAVQGLADVLIDGRQHPASLFAMTIAASGERKTSADRLVLRAHEQWEQDAWQLYREAMTGYEASMEIFKVRETEKKKKWKKLDQNVFRIHQQAAAEEAPPPDKPEVPTLIASDATYQGLYRAFSNGRPSQGLFSDEGGTFLGGWGMKSENLAYTVSSLSRLWDGSPLRWTRGGDQATAPLFHRRLSVHLLITPAVASRNLNDFMLGQGFLPRFLIARPESRIGFRDYRASDPTADSRVVDFWARMTGILGAPIPRTDDRGCDLRTVTLNSDAHELFVDVFNRWEQAIRPEGQLADAPAFAAKAAENMARIAATFALVDNTAAAKISLDHVAGAARLMDKHYLPEALRFVRMAAENNELADAQRLLDWLRKKRRGIPFKTRDVCREGPRCARKSAKVAQGLLAILIDHNYVQGIGREFVLIDEVD